MNVFENIKVLWQEKSLKKLSALSIAVFLLITAIVFFAVFELCGNIKLKQMGENLREIPDIIESRRNELFMRSNAFEVDTLARAELGMKIFTEENELTDEEKLEQVRRAVSADSVSILDGQRQVLSTTGPVSPKEIFNACIPSLEPHIPHSELYSVLSENGEETEEYDGKGYVLLPISENMDRSLVFEFSSEPVMELYNAVNDWASAFERVLSESNAFAFAKTGDKLDGYPLDGFTPEQISKLSEELTEIFRKSDSFRKTDDGTSYKVIKLLGNRYFAELTSYPEDNTDILVTLLLDDVIKNGIYIAVAISAIIGWGILLIRIYVFRCLTREMEGMDKKSSSAISLKQICQTTWPGILVVLLVTILFSYMLLALEDRTNATLTAIAKRQDLQYEIGLRKDQEKKFRKTFDNIYLSRAQMLADFLTENPDQLSHEGLEELNRIAATDYLMFFDRTGNEMLSSNSYTGFSVGKNLSEEYEAVLMGYPYAIVGPAADPYTGRMQLGTAIMMPDGSGQPDGFLLAVYSAGELSDELKRLSFENSVNSYAVREGHIAAAVSDSDGRFIAHSDPKMIGVKAEDYFPEGYKPGSSYEGFTTYDGKHVCVSAFPSDGKTLVFMVPESGDSYRQAGSLPLFLGIAVLLILAILYFPAACLLTARAIAESKGKLRLDSGKKNHVMVLYDGYELFLTLFTLFVLIATFEGWWKSFDYVLSGRWTRGLNLFALWAALFTLIVTLFVGLLINTALNLLENRLSLRVRTFTRLASSFIFYAAAIIIFFGILDIFGANTTTLLASAGVVSIAVGMGAKSMAEDLLAGFFMMLSGSVYMGDRVSVGGVTGEVTDMGIRTTEITDEQGNVVILNNSKVSGVRNMSRNQTQQEPEDKTKK